MELLDVRALVGVISSSLIVGATVSAGGRGIDAFNGLRSLLLGRLGSGLGSRCGHVEDFAVKMWYCRYEAWNDQLVE